MGRLFCRFRAWQGWKCADPACIRACCVRAWGYPGLVYPGIENGAALAPS